VRHHLEAAAVDLVIDFALGREASRWPGTGRLIM